MNEAGRVVIAGAGSIGCFVGGVLALGGRNVSLLARPRIADEIGAHGLHVTDLDGLDGRVPPDAVEVTADPAVLGRADLVLVTVKSRDTAEMADLVARLAPADAAVVSLQNGVANADVLRSRFPGRTVLAGMVPFNVVALGGGHFHRGTSGSIVVESAAPDVAAWLRVPHLPVDASHDMAGVLWGKLLFNLNNALNALSGLPLLQQLESRAWRTVLAAMIDEALTVLRAAGIRPATTGPLPPAFIPFVLRLPTFLYRRIAATSLRIDPDARSSMWEDLERRRPTEVDQLQGAVVDLARKLDRDAPVNQRVMERVRAAENANSGSPRLRPEQVLR